MVIFHSYNTHFLQATLGFELPTHGFDQRVYEGKNRDRMGQKPFQTVKWRYTRWNEASTRKYPIFWQAQLERKMKNWRFWVGLQFTGSAKGQKNGCRMLQVSGVIETLVLWIDHVSYLIETHGLGRSTTQFWCFRFGYRFWVRSQSTNIVGRYVVRIWCSQLVSLFPEVSQPPSRWYQWIHRPCYM